MIKQIIESLNKINEVSDWIITITKNKTTECFYVLEELETTRTTNTTDIEVTVYRKIEDNNETYMGSATITIPHKMTNESLINLLQDAVYSASLVNNKPYELVKGDKKLAWNSKNILDKPMKTLDKIAKIFFEVSSPNCKFNSLELFYYINNIHIINSQGVDYTKTINSLEVEAIPSFDGEKQKVEIYKYYRYKKVDYKQIKQDACDALNEALSRYNAGKLKEKQKLDIILKDDNVLRLVRALISTSSYNSVYKKSSLYKLNDLIQKDAIGDLLTITLAPLSENDGFDKDGVLLQPVTIVDKAKLVNYFGDNQYAYYLGVKPTGILKYTKVKPGSKSITDMKKKPHLEILSLSGLQVDIYNGYIGGEVRLANYFDGNNTIPLSGFSFSGNLNEVLKDIELSKERHLSTVYDGPKYLKLKNLEVL